MKTSFILPLATFAALAISSACYPTSADAQTLRVTIGTGGDDLRGGNTAFINLVRTGSGNDLTEQVLSRGLGGGSTVTSVVTFPEGITAAEIRTIRIRHDGNPRSGHPFDTYDNWDLQTLRVELINASSPPTLLYNSHNDARVGGLVARFTGDLRKLNLPIRAIGEEPDFIITRTTRTPTGVLVLINNIGTGGGILTQIVCSASGRMLSTRLTDPTPLRPGGFREVSARFSGAGRGTCTVVGTDVSRRPEVVTTNNVFAHIF